jgi:hypothetical protein
MELKTVRQLEVEWEGRELSPELRKKEPDIQQCACTTGIRCFQFSTTHALHEPSWFMERRRQ